MSNICCTGWEHCTLIQDHGGPCRDIAGEDRHGNKMMRGDVKVQNCLAELCSMFEHDLDVGGWDDHYDCLTHVRYTTIDHIPYFDVLWDNRVIRIEGTDMGPVNA